LKRKQRFVSVARRLIMEYDAAMHEAIGTLLKGGNLMVVGAGSRLAQARQALMDALETSAVPAPVVADVPPDPSRLASMEQLRAALGGVSASLVRVWCRDPEFPVVRVGRLCRYEIPAVQAWVRSGGPERAARRRQDFVTDRMDRIAAVGE
jgi:hypothetical protein